LGCTDELGAEATVAATAIFDDVGSADGVAWVLVQPSNTNANNDTNTIRIERDVFISFFLSTNFSM
jgi:hypothetical protein